MKKRVVGIALGTLALAGVVFASRTTFSRDRPDCPGKIVCPLTGEIICADQCPIDVKVAPPTERPSCCEASECE